MVMSPEDQRKVHRKIGKKIDSLKKEKNINFAEFAATHKDEIMIYLQVEGDRLTDLHLRQIEERLFPVDC